jgi:CrcB protein
VIALAVAVAGALGAASRALIERAVARGRTLELPFASYLINPLGSFLLALIVGLALDGNLSDEWRAVLGAGFCGAFTVVGPVTYDSVRLAENGRPGLAATNVAMGTLVPLAAAALGLALA